METTPYLRPSDDVPSVTRFHSLGTEVEVMVTETERLQETTEHVRRRFGEIDRTFSRFRVDSELSRIGWLTGIRQPASALFLELLELALRAARDTDGWFDPTVRDAVEATGYDRSIEHIETGGPGPVGPAAPAGQWDRITYDRERRWVCVPEGVRLDFGGIGKGFAVDYALGSLPLGHGGVLLNAGGDLAVRGLAPAGGWRIDVAAVAQASAETTVSLFAGALATSGLGRRGWVRDGVRLHHLIDPHTGTSGGGVWRSVTVVARDCAAADVAAKAAWLMGTAGAAWLAGLGLAGRFVTIDGRAETVGRWPAVVSRREPDRA